MAIPTSRTDESPQVRFNNELCNGCGLCVSVCSDNNLIIEDKKVCKSNMSLFDCIGCGHCMAICPTGAVEIHGRELSPSDIYELPPRVQDNEFEPLLATLQRRRSIRDFEDRPVPSEIIEKILTATRTAPMGLPPSDVNVLIFDSKKKNRAFAEDFADYLKGMSYMFSPLFLRVMRPIWGKETDKMFRSFLTPLFKAYTEDGIDKGVNVINYDAPLAMYFYGSPYCDPADPIITATYAMIAAESLGLGTCMLGAIHPFIQKGRSAAKFRKDHNIKFKSKEGLFVIFGYHKATYQKGVHRTFASVEYVE